VTNNRGGPAGWESLRSRRPVRLLVIALVMAMTATHAFAQDSDPGSLREQLQESQRSLEEARKQQAETKTQIGSAQQQLNEVDARLVALNNLLREKEAELAQAEAALAAAAERTAEAQAKLDGLTAELEVALDQLDEDKERFGRRIAAAYMYGGSLQMAEAILTSRDFSEMVTTGYYVDTVLRDDKSLVDRMTEQTIAITEKRREADIVRDQLATEEASAERARQDVARATEVQRDLASRAEEQRQKRAALLKSLEADLVAASAMVDEYEAESKRIQEELARSQWKAAAPGKGGLLWPTDGRAGSGYGYRTHPITRQRRMHTGVDIGAPTGQPIIAAAEGLVVGSGWRGGYGMTVVIDHGGGLATLYAHQSRLSVSQGQVVQAGQKIGEIGSTGQSTGPHLHYEVRVNGVPRDPMDWY
jgi:murein DD-endopeptidase MepM/ murein hydrolase activator NlpD